LHVAARAANAAAGWGAWDAAWDTVWEIRKAVGDKDVAQGNVEDRVQAALLREIINNPVQPCPSFHPAILTWHDGLLVSMGRQIYHSRDFSDTPILADTPEEAGCTNPDILSHCRQQGAVHVRGCWIVDLLLGKE